MSGQWELPLVTPRAGCLAAWTLRASLCISLVLVAAMEEPRVADGSGGQCRGPASGPAVGGRTGGANARQEVVPEAGDFLP